MVESPPSNSSPTNTSKRKRSYCKITQEQLNILKNIYSIYGDQLDISIYCNKTGIKPYRVKILINQLKKGYNIDKSSTKKGRKRILTENDSNIIVDVIRNNNMATLKEMQNSLDKPVSVSTISRHLNKRMKPRITLKRFTVRQCKADMDSSLNKSRLKVVLDMIGYMEQGLRPVFVDESHWSMGYIHGRARDFSGNTPVVHSKSGNSQLTVIASMSDVGMLYNLVIYGNNTSDIFNSYLKSLVNYIQPLSPCIIFMDNASIHHNPDAESIINKSGNILYYNVVYSPELNPIEEIFSIWKCRSESSCFEGREAILQKITDAFKTIKTSECFRTINNITRKKYREILQLAEECNTDESEESEYEESSDDAEESEFEVSSADQSELESELEDE